ncbi:MAG: MFS transporter [Xanthobacteraceae bacterium]
MSADAELGYTARGRKLVAWSAILGYAFDFYDLIIMAFLLVPIQNSLKVSLPQTGIVVSMTLAASVFGGILFGWFGDKVGRKNALLVTILLLAAGSILSAFAWDFTSLLTFRTITGIGVGGEWGAGMVLLNEVWDNRRRGLGSSVVQAMSAAGTVIAVIVATVSLTYLNPDTAWRVAFIFGGLPILFTLFIRARMPESPLWLEYDRRRKAADLPPEKLAESTPLIEIFKGTGLRYFVIGTIICGAYIINYQSISIFMPTLMLRDLGTNLAALRTITLYFALALAVGMVGTGYLSDLWGRKRAIVTSTFIGIIGLALIYAGGALRYPGDYLGWTLFWGYMVWGLGQGAIGQFGPWYSELYPVEMRSTATSTIFTTGRLVGSVAPYLVPVIAAAVGSLRDAMMLAVVGSVISFVFAFMLPETAGRRFAVVDHVVDSKEKVEESENN